MGTYSLALQPDVWLEHLELESQNLVPLSNMKYSSKIGPEAQDAS